jgi:hypothetical protein
LLLIEITNDVQNKGKDPSNAKTVGNIEIRPTPIHVMQGVGLELGIEPEKIMKEKLESDPTVPSSHANDDYCHSKFGDQATPQQWPLSLAH